jgi:flagellar basal body-associated protein FliL
LNLLKSGSRSRILLVIMVVVVVVVVVVTLVVGMVRGNLFDGGRHLRESQDGQHRNY